MKPQIMIEESSPGQFELKTNIVEKSAVAMILLDLAKNIVAQMAKKKGLVEVPEAEAPKLVMM